jgi:hypothetical protein
MKREYRDLKKIVEQEGGEITEINQKTGFDKVTITFGGQELKFKFSVSKHCNFQNMIKTQIRNLKRLAA